MDFQAAIITPSGKVFDAQLNALRAPGTEGEFGILGGHAPFLATLKKGVLKLHTQAGREVYFAIASGVLEVSSEHQVLVLCDRAVDGGSFDEAKKLSEEFEKK